MTKYREGGAFKRWLLRGWGATELSMQCDLKDEKNNLVGSAVTSREIVAGGLYTIGAWKTVFKDVTDDVATEYTIPAPRGGVFPKWFLSILSPQAAGNTTPSDLKTSLFYYLYYL